MKFKIQVTNGKIDWWEDYDLDIDSPIKYAIKGIEHFNQTLRPFELPRILLDVETINFDNKKFHKWEKITGGSSVRFKNSIVDLFYCRKCGITGKRFGLADKIKIDSKYKKKVYQHCDTAQQSIRE